MGSQAWNLGWQQGANNASEQGQHKRNRKEQLQDEERNARLKPYVDLFDQNRISPTEFSHAIEDIYHDAEPQRKMTLLGRFLNRKKIRQQAAQEAQGRASRAQDASSILANAKSSAQVDIDTDAAKKQAAIASLKQLFPDATPDQLAEMKERILAPGAIHRPTADENARQDYQAALQGGYKGSFEQWKAEQSAKGHEAGAPKPKTQFQQYEDAYKKQYNISPEDPLTLSDLGYLVEQMKYDQAHGTTSVQTRLEKQADGTILPVTVWNTTGVKGAPKSPRSGGEESTAKPSKSSKSSPVGRVQVGSAFGTVRPTADVIKARKDYEDAVALADVAKSVSQHPNDAINQKRLAVQLERLSAGRFTTQALDYVIKAGWGNTIEQWANNPNTGALPADVMRQLVDGANENLQAAKVKLDTAQNLGKGPAPKADDSADDEFLQKVK